MFKIKIADIVVEIDNIYSYIEKVCSDYIFNGDGFDFQVATSQQEIDKERKKMSDGDSYSNEYIENICIYRKIALLIPQKDAFVMHSAVVGVGDKAYAFSAKSGTGKSTHITLWKQFLGSKVYIINGDKPIIRLVDDKLYAYGTPWCGKEMWQTNTRAELNGICFLERGENNIITKLTPSDAVSLVMKQILIPSDAYGVEKTFELVEKLLNETNLWKLSCNISVEAAIKSFNAMHGGIYEN